ncbi:integrase [Mesorhizobium sp. YC-39]|uniref:integrase n=1 Tax=unclassified Mesorhizobium TaxID=325217 RepID=UPI0021E8681D|nr:MULTISPECIES: integrase [unclassified Mesorhizobium]MCV3209647.1 integrase [Mesorhizobium sp. YC-2]MCV3230177.1 integrase [Mesorhizobium sp. YC-39]
MTEQRKDRPGYKYRPRADGSRAHYWVPQRACKSAPGALEPRPITDEAIAGAMIAHPELATPDDAVAKLCRTWTDELLADLDHRGKSAEYDGSVASAVMVYRTHPQSPYKALKHATRIRDYDPSLKLIRDTVGKRRIANLVGSDFRRWFEQWGSKGRARRAHGAIRKLRSVLSFGTTERLAGCAQAREILSLMEFATPEPRRVKMEYRHALLVCAMAIRKNRPSIALTQALQWDTALRRIHIIGEWLPLADGDAGGIVRGNTKWRGLTVADISADHVLTVPITAKNKAATEHDLSKCPLVQMVLKRIKLPAFGPLVVSEVTSLPYRENYYATDWREIATAAKVPESIWSMDTRAGAISEAEIATDLESARKMAGHTTAKTTQGYVRNGDLDNNRKVADARAKLRS